MIAARLTAIDDRLRLSSLTDVIASKTPMSARRISIQRHNRVDDRRLERDIDYIDLH